MYGWNSRNPKLDVEIEKSNLWIHLSRTGLQSKMYQQKQHSLIPKRIHSQICPVPGDAGMISQIPVKTEDKGNM